MKPKYRVYCPAIRRTKMLFETEKKALLFIEYNGPELEKDGKKAENLRAYFCAACGGWHITSKNLPVEKQEELDRRVDNMIEHSSKKSKEMKKVQEDVDKTCYGYILSLPLIEIGGKKKLRKYIGSHLDSIPQGITVDRIYHVIKSLPDTIFKSEQELPAPIEEIKKQAEALYDEIPFENLKGEEMILRYIKWEFVYNRKINLYVISELENILRSKKLIK